MSDQFFTTQCAAREFRVCTAFQSYASFVGPTSSARQTTKERALLLVSDGFVNGLDFEREG